MPDITPAWIASRLTEPQRQALLWLPGDGGERECSAIMEHYDGLYDLWPLEFELENGDLRVSAALVSAGFGPWSATPLGLAVRAVVAGEAGRG